MALKAGIIGLPNVGKSTLFNAITNSKVEVANYPFATIIPNIGIVELLDKRLEKLANIISTKKIIPATFEFTDIAGLVKGASKGEGLGNKFLANIRETNAIIHVLRCFEDNDITHVYDSIDPIRDLEIINLELLLADLSIIEIILNKKKNIFQSSRTPQIKLEYFFVQKLYTNLKKGVPIRQISFNEVESKLIKDYQFITNKPILYIANIDEKYISNPEQSILFNKLKNKLKQQGDEIIAISSKIENELSQLNKEDKKMFLNDLGIKTPGLNKIVYATFQLLKLATYFTVGHKEIRAWTFNLGLNAAYCAGIIHTDFQKGFIKAEIINYKDYIKHNGENGAKEAGKMRLEGKEYIMKDGDICYFRFNI